MKDEAKAGDLRSGGAPASGDARSVGPAERRRPTTSGNNLDDFTRTRLGTHLRVLYDQVVQQPVPDRFRDLIARLEASEDGQSPAAGDENLDSGRA